MNEQMQIKIEGLRRFEMQSVKRDWRFSNHQLRKTLVPMKLSEIMASGDIGVRSLPGCWRGHRLNKRIIEKNVVFMYAI